jgi:hypothetical protein
MRSICGAVEQVSTRGGCAFAQPIFRAGQGKISPGYYHHLAGGEPFDLHGSRATHDGSFCSRFSRRVSTAPPPRATIARLPKSRSD